MILRNMSMYWRVVFCDSIDVGVLLLHDTTSDLLNIPVHGCREEERLPL